MAYKLDFAVNIVLIKTITTKNTPFDVKYAYRYNLYETIDLNCSQ